MIDSQEELEQKIDELRIIYPDKQRYFDAVELFFARPDINYFAKRELLSHIDAKYNWVNNLY
jgi:hypothetical protein